MTDVDYICKVPEVWLPAKLLLHVDCAMDCDQLNDKIWVQVNVILMTHLQSSTQFSSLTGGGGDFVPATIWRSNIPSSTCDRCNLLKGQQDSPRDAAMSGKPQRPLRPMFRASCKCVLVLVREMCLVSIRSQTEAASERCGWFG